MYRWGNPKLDGIRKLKNFLKKNYLDIKFLEVGFRKSKIEIRFGVSMLKLLQEFVGCNYKDLQLNRIFYTVVPQTPGFDFVCGVSVERVRNGGEIVTAVNGLGTGRIKYIQ